MRNKASENEQDKATITDRTHGTARKMLRCGPSQGDDSAVVSNLDICCMDIVLVR